MRSSYARCSRIATAALILAGLTLARGEAGAQEPTSQPILDSPTWQRAVEALRKGPIDYATRNPRAGLQTATDYAYAIFYDHTPRDRLVKLTEDGSAYMRVYAYLALNEKYPELDLFDIAYRSLRDDAVVRVATGRTPQYTKVGDHIGYLFAFSASPERRNRIVRFLLTESHGLKLLETALSLWTIPTEYRSHLYQLVEGGNGTALRAIARWRDRRDTNLILTYAERYPFDALYAIEQFPHPDFLPLVRAIHGRAVADLEVRQAWPTIHEALVAFGAKTAVPILRTHLNRCPPVPQRALLVAELHAAVEGALAAQPDFLPFLFELWQSDHQVGDRGFQSMRAHDPERVRTLSRTTLQNGQLSAVSEGAAASMLNIVMNRQRASDRQLLDTLILTLPSADLYPVLEYVARNKPSHAIDPLFQRLERPGDRDAYVLVAEAILAYQHTGLRARLVQTRLTHAHLRTGDVGQDLVNLLGQ